MNEGKYTLGLWLPLALAHLTSVVISALGGKVNISELLDSYGLTNFAEAFRREEKESENQHMVDWFNGMKERYGGTD